MLGIGWLTPIPKTPCPPGVTSHQRSSIRSGWKNRLLPCAVEEGAVPVKLLPTGRGAMQQEDHAHGCGPGWRHLSYGTRSSLTRMRRQRQTLPGSQRSSPNRSPTPLL